MFNTNPATQRFGTLPWEDGDFWFDCLPVVEGHGYDCVGTVVVPNDDGLLYASFYSYEETSESGPLLHGPAQVHRWSTYTWDLYLEQVFTP